MYTPSVRTLLPVLPLLAALFAGLPAVAAPPDAVWAEWQQEEAPELRARRASAEAKETARARFFAGTATFETAFPHLVDRTLTEPSMLRGALALLDGQATNRARERTAILPRVAVSDGANRTRARSMEVLRADVFDAEDRADGLERRFLVGLLAVLEAQPALNEQELEALREPLRARVEAGRVDGPEGEPARRDAALADEALAALDARVQDILLASVVPGAEAPEVEGDIAQLTDPLRANDAAARLELTLPLLDEEASSRAQAGLITWMSGAQAASLERSLAEVRAQIASPDEPTAAREALEARRNELEEEKARLVAERDALPAEGALSGARRALTERELELNAAQLELVGLQLGLGKKRNEAEDAAKRIDSQQQTARSKAVGELLREVGTAQTRAEGRLEGESADAVLTAELASLKSDVAGSRSAIEAITQAAILVDLETSPDVAYGDLRVLLTRARQLEEQAVAGMAQASSARVAMLQSLTREQEQILGIRGRASALELTDDERLALETSLKSWQLALASEERAAALSVATTESVYRDSLRLLRSIHGLRHELEPFISARVWSDDQNLADLGWELRLVGPSSSVAFMDRLRKLDPRGTDLRAVRVGMESTFWVLLVVVLWWVLRRGADRAATSALGRVAQWLEALREEDVATTQPSVARALQTSLDLAAGYVLVAPLSSIPFIGEVLTVYLHLAAYRLFMALFDVLVARHTEVRPSLLTLQPDSYAQAYRSLRALVAWLMLQSVAVWFVADVLLLEAFPALLSWAFTGVFFGIVVWLLYRWEPALRATLGRRDQSLRIVAWLSEPGVFPMRPLRSMVAFAFLGASFLFEVLPRLAREGTSLGRLFNMVGRYQLATTDDDGSASVPPEVRAAILAQRATVPRGTCIDELENAIRTLRHSDQRCLIALVADRGGGKTLAVDQVLERVAELEVPTTRAVIRERITSSSQALAWLREVTGATGDDEEAIAAHLAGIAPRFFVVEGLHQSFLRAVHGFSGLRTLLDVMNASCRRHVWITTIHRPAWLYLSRLGDLVGTEVYTLVADLPSMGEQDLRTLTVQRTRDAGFAVDFRGLSRATMLGADPEVELERTKSIFYRLLAEASRGNPSIAMMLWVQCLAPTSDPDRLEVRMARALDTGVVDGLVEADLFTLVALRTQGALDERELMEVTNMSPGRVRMVVKHLLGRGLLEVRDGQVEITLACLPQVTRTLARRHFLQWAG